MKRLLTAALLVALFVGMATAATTYKHNGVVQNVRGDAVGGATVTVYLANSTNKATLYGLPTDAVGSISNPTYTDAYGRYDFYVLPGTYDVEISGVGITTYTIEDVRVFGHEFSWYDVTDYGAIAGDATSDSTAFQDAINAAEAAGGGDVVVPDGEFNIPSFLVIDSANVTLRGMAGSRVVADTTSGAFVLKISADNVTVRDLVFVGGKTVASGSANECISLLSGATNTTIMDCTFTGSSATTGFNVHIRGASGCTNPTVTGNRFERIIGTSSGYGYGIQFASVVGGEIANNVFEYSTSQGRHQVYLSAACTDIIIRGNRLYGGKNAMITVYSNTDPAQRISIVGNVLDGAGTGGGISSGAIEFVDEVNSSIISGNVIDDANGFGIKLEGAGDFSSECVDNAVIGNIITAPDSSGIYLKGAQRITVTGNRIDSAVNEIGIEAVDTGSSLSDDGMIASNHITNCTTPYDLESGVEFELVPATVEPDTTGRRGLLWLDNTNSVLKFYDGITWRSLHASTTTPVTVSWSMPYTSSSAIDYFAAGYYFTATADEDFNPAATFGSANAAYAAHFFVVCASGATDTELTVTGTSITDAGVRTASDTEVLQLTDGSADAYYETTKKWLGQVSVEKTAGTDRLVDFGFCKYWDNRNTDFTVVGGEALWAAGANSSSFDIVIYHHKTTGWTYNAGATGPTPPVAFQLSTDYVTERNLVANQQGAWKRTGLSLDVAGSGSEGIIIEIIPGANNAVEGGTITLSYTE